MYVVVTIFKQGFEELIDDGRYKIFFLKLLAHAAEYVIYSGLCSGHWPMAIYINMIFFNNKKWLKFFAHRYIIILSAI